jgi:hypothetical protein
MAIVTTKDPRTKKELILAEGVVKAVYFNEIKPEHKKDYGKDGKSWIPTHRVVVHVDDDKIGAGMYLQEEGKELKLRAKDADGKHQDVVKGAEVSITVTRAEDYKGMAQYKCFGTDIMVTKVAEQEASSGSGNAPKQKADPTEIVAGNARNAAAIMVRRFGYDFNEAITYVAQVGHNAKVEYAATDSKLTSFQVGVSVGEALKVAAELAADAAAMPDYITAYLAEQVPHSLQAIRALPKDSEFVTPELPNEAGKAKTSKPKATKPAAKAKEEAPVKEPEVAEEEDSDQIPF